MSINKQPLSIDKCILSFSHDKYSSRKKANAIAIAKAEREIAAKRKGVSHLILRAADDQIDCLKFLFPIGGVPAMCYALGNLLISSLKNIVIIGGTLGIRLENRYSVYYNWCFNHKYDPL